MQRGNLAPSLLPEVEPGLDAAEESNTDISHSLQVTSLLLLQPQIRQCPFPGHPVQLLLLNRAGRREGLGRRTVQGQQHQTDWNSSKGRDRAEVRAGGWPVETEQEGSTAGTSVKGKKRKEILWGCSQKYTKAHSMTEPYSLCKS